MLFNLLESSRKLHALRDNFNARRTIELEKKLGVNVMPRIVQEKTLQQPEHLMIQQEKTLWQPEHTN